VLYRIEKGKKWRKIRTTLDSNSKYLESIDFNIDLHQAFVSHYTDERYRTEVVRVIPWKGRFRDLEIMSE
jgi:hypothetical protein